VDDALPLNPRSPAFARVGKSNLGMGRSLHFLKPSVPWHLAKIRDQECLDFVITHILDDGALGRRILRRAS
jgi:hypothetical protein